MTYFLFLLGAFWVSLASAGNSLQHRVEAYTLDSGQVVKVTQREVTLSDNATEKQPSPVVGEVLVDTFDSSSATMPSHSLSHRYIKGESQREFSPNFQVHMTYTIPLVGADSLRARDVIDQGMLGVSATFTPRNLSWNLEAAAKSTEQLTQFNEQAAAQARAWSELNRQQLENQDAIVHDIREGLVNYKISSDRFVTRQALGALGEQWKTLSLSDNLEQLEMAQSLQNIKPTLVEVSLSEEKQKESLENLSEIFANDPALASRLVSDLVTPLNKTRLPQINEKLKKLNVVNGVIPGNILGRGEVSFESPYLEDRRIRVQNKLQTMGLNYPSLLRGKGWQAARSVQAWLKAARQREQRGQFSRAFEMLKRAEAVMNSAPDSEAWAREAFVEALDAYSEDFAAGPALTSLKPSFLKRAKPVGRILNHQQTHGASSEIKTTAQAGLHFLQLADQNSSRGQTELEQIYYNLSVAALDTTLGLLPFTSVPKDAYELATGTHLLTGVKLSSFERGLALAGVLTAGFGTTPFKVVKSVGSIAREWKVSGAVLKEGQRAFDVLKKAGVRSGVAFREFKNKMGVHQTRANFESALLSIHQGTKQRLDSFGLRYGFREVLPAKVLNQRMLKVAGDHYEYVKPGTWGIRIRYKDDPSRLMRASFRGGERGAFYFHKDLYNKLLGQAKSAEDLAFKLKNELNLSYTPTHVFTLPKRKKGYDMIVSQIKKVDGVGFGEGQLQFELSKRLKPGVAKNLGTIEKLFPKGKL